MSRELDENELKSVISAQSHVCCETVRTLDRPTPRGSAPVGGYKPDADCEFRFTCGGPAARCVARGPGCRRHRRPGIRLPGDAYRATHATSLSRLHGSLGRGFHYAVCRTRCATSAAAADDTITQRYYIDRARVCCKNRSALCLERRAAAKSS